MATVTHIIRSYYDPADREKLEHETRQLDTDDQSDPWQTESSLSAQRRIRTAPTFVPATIAHDERGVPSHTSSPTVDPARPLDESVFAHTSTADWYRSLTAASSSQAPPRPSSASGPILASPSPATSTHQTRPLTWADTTRHWFIRKAMGSAPPTQLGSPLPLPPPLPSPLPLPSPSPAPLPSLADLLARNPPPLPTEARYTPPVWLHIGPSNKGFRMLQRGGWREGEGLGAHARQAAPVADGDPAHDAPEVVDLTLSDSDASEEAWEACEIVPGPVRTGEAAASDVQRALLTPLPTVLKADRLGIGMKAKTEGPYKRSKKRVTHNAAALAAHIRSAEELRKSKAAVGRGKRGFAKIHKREVDRRKAMLAYLNE